MPDSIPYIVMAFADPDKNLRYTGDERDEVVEMLNANKAITRRGFDVLPLHKADRGKIDNSFNTLKTHRPFIFHYSGHADNLKLKLEGGGQPGAPELSILFKGTSIQIVFLNGCSTKEMVKEILEKSEVKIVIATIAPVRDDLAKEVSIGFYKNFIEENYTLHKSLERLQFNEELRKSCLASNGIATSEIGWEDEAEKLDANAEFLWGLFYSDPNIKHLTFDELIDNSNDTLADLEKKIKAAEEAMLGSKELFDWAKQSGKDPASTAYKQAEDNYTRTTTEHENLVRQRNEIKQKKAIEEELRSRDKREQYLESVLRVLNYDEQREHYLITGTCFGGFAVSGDEHSCHELLCENFLWENNINEKELIEYLIDPNVAGSADFWIKIAREIDLNLKQPVLAPGESRTGFGRSETIKKYQQEVVKKLFDEYYIERSQQQVKERATKKNILFKIKMRDVEIESWSNIISDFWETVDWYLTKYPPPDKNYNKWFKMAFLLLDEKSNQQRYELLKQQIEKIALSVPAVFCALPPITPLTEAKLREWFRTQRIHTIGIQDNYLNNLFGNCETVKMMRLIYALRAASPEAKIFKRLNLPQQL